MFSDDDIKDFIDSDDQETKNIYSLSVDEVIINETIIRINVISKNIEELKEVAIKILDALDGSK